MLVYFNSRFWRIRDPRRNWFVVRWRVALPHTPWGHKSTANGSKRKLACEFSVQCETKACSCGSKPIKKVCPSARWSMNWDFFHVPTSTMTCAEFARATSAATQARTSAVSPRAQHGQHARDHSGTEKTPIASGRSILQPKSLRFSAVLTKFNFEKFVSIREIQSVQCVLHCSVFVFARKL